MVPDDKDGEPSRAELAKRNAAWARTELLIGIVVILVGALLLNLIWMAA